ncbi:hypothetical protein [Pararhizobium arenae]|uniref:hypothetical protein n=1 Tax=Pararhizobium arenae TaxID=1856850 RepID=UPI00094B6216|nr:hypothetical protein [Pararhizobium arenae]
MDHFTDINNLEDYPDVAAALGNMVVAWADAETAMVFALAAVMGSSANMSMMGYYRIPTFEARVKFILALVDEWETDKFDRPEIAKAIKSISGISGTRNGWVHGIWSANKNTKELVVFNLRAREGNGRMKPVKAHDILDHCNTLRTTR